MVTFPALIIIITTIIMIMIMIMIREAVTIDSCYNGGFMAGRIVSAFVAAVLLPRFILMMMMMRMTIMMRTIIIIIIDQDNDPDVTCRVRGGGHPPLLRRCH